MQPTMMSVDELVRSIEVRSDSPHVVLLGAGASISSGVPSAGNCIWMWKKSLFTSNNTGSESDVAELSLESVRKRIDGWLGTVGLKPDEDVDDYGFYIEKCHPLVSDRDAFFKRLVRGKEPHVGYKLLAHLASAGLVRSVWTTNFDGLAAKAILSSDVTPIEVGVDSQHRTFRSPSTSEVICVSLHGDYRYDHLKNTEAELQEQESKLIKSLAEVVTDHSLIVCGYSGRDESLMNALTEAYRQPGTGRLYWCNYSHDVERTVADLFTAASTGNREAFFIPGVDFDNLMIRLGHQCLKGGEKEAAKELLSVSSNDVRSDRKKFTLPSNATKKRMPLKTNAWRIKCPTEVFDFDVNEWPSSGAWKWLRERTADSKVEAVPLHGRILALGTSDDVKKLFPDMKDDIKRVPVSGRDFKFEDGAIVSLMRTALVRSLAEKHSLDSNAKDLLWLPTRKHEQHSSYPISMAARVSLRHVAGRNVVCLDPTVHVHAPEGTSRYAVDAARNAVLGYQHNKEFNDDLNFWLNTLFKKGEETAIDFPLGSSAFEFRIAAAPSFVNVLDVPGGKGTSRGKGRAFENPIAKAVEIDEPKLRFGDRGGTRHLDTLPLRGIKDGKPFDVSLNDAFGQDDLPVAVVCPRAETHSLTQFLKRANSEISSPGKGESEYMPNYRGFESLYGTRLRVAKPQFPSWVELPEIKQSDEIEATRELAKNIIASVDKIAALDNTVVLIVTPDRWSKYRRYETDSEVFDVHDYVKAHCVRKGIATQFLDQSTFSDRNPCRVWWWLSLAIYAKSPRTPWVLDSEDNGTSFVGLGYSVDRHAEKGKKIVLGCSHIYNSNGQGMQFRLTKIDDPRWVGRDPFLKEDEARSLGETVRTLFWHAHNDLPKRVVFHKQTPFLKSECDGLFAGLDGVECVDMVEVNYESSLRLVNSEVDYSGNLKESRWPVRRGTLAILSDFEALLYVHGATDAADSSRTYFQGKRRIPGPLRITRHAGTTDVAQLASEILGLSKMDWNSGDLYGKLPATIHSSRVVAKIARLLERFEGVSYDYRLFM